MPLSYAVYEKIRMTLFAQLLIWCRVVRSRDFSALFLA